MNNVLHTCMKANILLLPKRQYALNVITWHYQISVKAIETVSCVGVIVWLGLPVANVVHDLVLSLTRNLSTTEQQISSAIAYMYIHQ